jgi:protease-4
MSKRATVAALATLGVMGVASSSPADPAFSVSETLPVPGRNIASNDEASAVATNPANIPFLPDPELRWTFTYVGDDAPLPIRGHAIDLAAPLWIFGTGLRVELFYPPTGAPAPFQRPYQWVRWGLGGRVEDWLGLGASFGWSLSPSQALDAQFGVTAGFTLRPWEWVSFSGVVRDFNVPVSRDGLTQSDRAWESGLAFRPIVGRRDFEFGVEGRYYDQQDKGSLRTTLGVDIPYVGRLRGDLEWVDVDLVDPDFMATAGLDINYGPFQGSGGAIFGDAIGLDATGFYAGAAIRAYREPGIPLMKYVVRIDIDETPGTRGHVALLRRLWRLADNPEIAGVLFVLYDEPSSSLAHAEELGDAIRTLRARGKKVACHMEDAKGRSLFVCSQADRIAMNPAGGLRFAGFSSRYFYFADTLGKLGVKSDFVRIGAHKLAAEQLTMSAGTDVAQRDHQELVDQYADVFLHDVGGGRKISKRKLRTIIDKGPYIAREAKEAGLVDALVYPDEMGRFVDELMGGRTAVIKSLPLSNAPRHWNRDDKLAIVYLAGDMVDGESQNIPIVNIRLAGSRTISAALRRVREDSSIKGVVFRIETGGGSSLAADVIHREAQLLAKKKPMIVSMGSSAASGGYYAAVNGAPIYANRTTLTGSIGIFYGKVDVSGLLGKLGVGSESFRSAPRADAESFFRPFTDDERDELGRKVKQFYDLFIGRVADGRRMNAGAVDALARGKVWTGAQAKEKNLVDRVAGLREAVEELRKQANLPLDTPIIELPEEDDSLLGFLLSLVGLDAGESPVSFVLPPGMLDVARALAPFMIYEGSKPLARVEWFEEGDYGARLTKRRGAED